MMGGDETGKDFAMGEVTAIDAPQITIQRPDNVTQKLNLTQETSLRKGSDNITVDDIKRGDHVFVGGTLQNNVIVLKSVQVIPPEQWNACKARSSAGTSLRPIPNPIRRSNNCRPGRRLGRSHPP